MDRSLHPPLLQNPACALSTHEAPQSCACCHQHPSGHSPPVGLMIWGLAPPPHGVSLPHASTWGLALMQRYFLRSLTRDRPHVSISEALRSALASCGIPPDTPYGWHLLTTMRKSTCQVTPSPVPIGRIRRAVLSTGFRGSAYRSVMPAAGAPSCAFWLQRVSLVRWVVLTMAHHTFACAAHRCLLDGIPGVRLPGSAFYPRFRPLRTSRRSGGYAVTPAPGGRDLHPHDELSYKACGFAIYPRTSVLFRSTGRTEL
jgi:hypothetical protein